jgi:putative ABC transport system permease protein
MAGFRKGNLRLAVASLKVANMRSFLTMLGIIIGVVAVTLVVCIGQGVKQQISNQVSHYGKDIITIRPGSSTSGFNIGAVLGGNGLAPSTSSLLSKNDFETVNNTPGVKYSVPLSVASGSAAGDHSLTSPLIIATSNYLPDVIDQSLSQGGFFDGTSDNHQVVLGSNAAKKLFNDAAPLGESLTYRGQKFIVTGIFASFPTAPFSLSANFNDAIFLPYGTAATLSGGDLSLYQILVKSNSVTATPAVASAIQARLTHVHGGAVEDSILTGDQATGSSDSIIHLLTLLIVGVAIISLIVGGIGIMNIMLVSVTERMHEIGLRKAIGATNKQILRQFVAEAFVISFTGAVIGTAISAAIVGLLRVYSSLQPVLVWQVLVAAPLVAIVVGVFFGTIPALKAARKDPIEALRHV